MSDGISDCARDYFDQPTKDGQNETQVMPNEPNQYSEPIHEFFELTYAQYLTIPRSILQSMPKEWQKKFTELLNVLWDLDWTKHLTADSMYKVELRKYHYDINDEFVWDEEILDPLADYDRGRRKIELASNK